jgi:hypothetical protein
MKINIFEEIHLIRSENKFIRFESIKKDEKFFCELQKFILWNQVFVTKHSKVKKKISNLKKKRTIFLFSTFIYF